MLLATRTCVHVWQTPYTQQLDGELCEARFGLVDLPWHTFALLPDGMHFTWAGYVAFVRAVVGAVSTLVPSGEPLHIVADSTVGHWDYSARGEYTRRASRLLRDRMATTGRVVRVDAVCGAGFSARADEQLHFRSMRRRWTSKGTSPAVLVIGGWNDEPHPWEKVTSAVRAFARPVRNASLARHEDAADICKTTS